MSTDTDVATPVAVPTETVRLATLGSNVATVPFTAGMTVANLLEMAGVIPKPSQVFRIDNQPVNEDTELSPEDLVVVVGPIRGGN